MRLRSEIHDDLRPFLPEKIFHRPRVADVRPHEPEITLRKYLPQILQPSRIRQLVHADNPVPRMPIHPVPYKVTPNKPGPAGYKNNHG